MALTFVGEIRKYLALLPAPHSAPLCYEFDSVVAALTEQFGRPPTLEPFFEALDDSLDAHYQGAGRVNAVIPSRAVERIHYETKRVIQEQCAVREPERARFLDRLMDDLAGQRNYPIASLNYDNLIEIACARRGLSFFEPVIDGEQERNIRLVKVHGSVTWLPDSKTRKIVRNEEYSSAITRQLGELRSAVLETPMIYPSRKKMPIHAPFMRNSLELQELFATRPFCVAVGYSFPDLHVRSWLETAIKNNPDFILYVVGPKANNPVFENLVANLPDIRWTSSLRIVGMGFGAAIEIGLERCLNQPEMFGPQMNVISADNVCRTRRRTIYAGAVSGIGASRDGKELFVSVPSKSSVQAIDLDTGSVSTPADRLKDPRGIACGTDGSLFIVQNRLMRWKKLPTTGAGNVIQIAPTGMRRILSKIQLKEFASLAKKLLAGARWSELRASVTSVLSWPTDVTVQSIDGRVFVTEARALAEVTADQPPSVICVPPLAFNLHGLDSADDGGLIGVEQGIGQTFSWGRVERFSFIADGVTFAISEQLNGLTRLMAICYVPDRRKVVVSQTLSWPLGALIVADYPKLDNAKILRGFDFPQKLEFVPHRDTLALSTKDGVELMPLSDLDDAKPINEGRRGISFTLGA
jgi:hypothetical protein